MWLWRKGINIFFCVVICMGIGGIAFAEDSQEQLVEALAECRKNLRERGDISADTFVFQESLAVFPQDDGYFISLGNIDTAKSMLSLTPEEAGRCADLFVARLLEQEDRPEDTYHFLEIKLEPYAGQLQTRFRYDRYQVYYQRYYNGIPVYGDVLKLSVGVDADGVTPRVLAAEDSYIPSLGEVPEEVQNISPSAYIKEKQLVRPLYICSGENQWIPYYMAFTQDETVENPQGLETVREEGISCFDHVEILNSSSGDTVSVQNALEMLNLLYGTEVFQQEDGTYDSQRVWINGVDTVSLHDGGNLYLKDAVTDVFYGMFQKGKGIESFDTAEWKAAADRLLEENLDDAQAYTYIGAVSSDIALYSRMEGGIVNPYDMVYVFIDRKEGASGFFRNKAFYPMPESIQAPRIHESQAIDLLTREYPFCIYLKKEGVVPTFEWHGQKRVMVSGIDESVKSIAGAGTGYAQTAYFYQDIQGHWAQKYIEALGRVGVGLPYENYQPDGVMTQRELLYMIFTCNSVFDWDDRSILQDTQRLYEEVGARVPAEQYDPDCFVTREDAVRFIMSDYPFVDFADKPQYFKAVYADMEDISPQCRGFVALAREIGLIGEGDGNFYPKRCVSRAEVAAMLYRNLTNSY